MNYLLRTRTLKQWWDWHNTHTHTTYIHSGNWALKHSGRFSFNHLARSTSTMDLQQKKLWVDCDMVSQFLDISEGLHAHILAHARTHASICMHACIHTHTHEHKTNSPQCAGHWWCLRVIAVAFRSFHECISRVERFWQCRRATGIDEVFLLSATESATLPAPRRCLV